MASFFVNEHPVWNSSPVDLRSSDFS